MTTANQQTELRPGGWRASALRTLPWLVLALALIAGALWQWQGRAHQRIDIGAPLDDGYTLDFNAPERSDNIAALSFRWSQPASRLRLWAPPPGAPLLLTLTMLAPAQPTGPQRVALSVAGHPLASVALTEHLRRYRFITTTRDTQELLLGLESPPLAIAGDPRALGVSLDRVALDVLRGPTAGELLRELWLAPLLPLALLLLALCGLLLRLRPLSAAGLPALALIILALLDQVFRDARLLLASYLLVAAAVAAGALLLAALLRRVPQLWPADDRRALRWIMLVFVVTLVATFTPVVRNDGVEYYAYLRSLAADGDLQFADEYSAPVFPQRPEIEKMPVTPTGHIANLASVGPALLWSPFYAVAHVIALGGRALGAPWQADGYDAPYIVLCMFASALSGLVILLAGYRICRRWVGPPAAALAMISALLGSNLLFYTMHQGSFAHAFSAAAATLYLLAWLRLEEQPSVRRWAALGVTAGAMVLMYWISALVLLLPMLTFVRLLSAALRGPVAGRSQQLWRLGSGAAVAAALALLVFSPQLLAWKVVYGTFLAIPHGGDYIRPRSFQGLELLFSHLYGLLPWTPAFFAGLVGLPLLWRRSRWLTLALALGFLAYFWYNASLQRWFAGGSFGLRRLTVLTPWFLIGLALLFDLLRRWRAALPFALAALMNAWALLLLVRYDLFLIPHVPEALGAMPTPSFYLSRDTLPLWGVLDWLRGGYFPKQMRAWLALQSGESLVLVVVMIALTWLVFAGFGWLDARRRSPAPRLSLRRRPLPAVPEEQRS
jgi:hypothetical protein